MEKLVTEEWQVTFSPDNDYRIIFYDYETMRKYVQAKLAFVEVPKTGGQVRVNVLYVTKVNPPHITKTDSSFQSFVEDNSPKVSSEFSLAGQKQMIFAPKKKKKNKK